MLRAGEDNQGLPHAWLALYHLSHFPKLLWSGSFLVVWILPPNRRKKNHTKIPPPPASPQSLNITKLSFLELHNQESPVKSKCYQTGRNKKRPVHASTLIVWSGFSAHTLPTCYYAHFPGRQGQRGLGMGHGRDWSCSSLVQPLCGDHPPWLCQTLADLVMWAVNLSCGRHASGEGDKEAKHRERGACRSGSSKENFLAFILVISSPGGIKGSLRRSASSGRLINISKGHTQCARPTNGSANAEVPVFQKGQATRSGKYSLEDRAGWPRPWRTLQRNNWACLGVSSFSSWIWSDRCGE